MQSLFRALYEFLSQPLAGSPLVGWHVVFLVVTAGTLLILFWMFRRQWARTPGVWKCVILSGLAHVVLIVIAYSTQYVVVAVPPPKGEGTPIRIIDFDPAIPDDQQASSPRVQFWEQFAGEVPAPAVETLERPREEPELVIEPIWGTAAAENANSPLIEAVPPVARAPEITIEAAQPMMEPPLLGEFKPRQLTAPISPSPAPIARQVDEATSVQPELEAAAAAPPAEQLLADNDPPLEMLAPPPVDAPLPRDLPIETLSGEFKLESLPPVEPGRLVAFERPTPLEPRVPRRFGDSQPIPKIYALRAPEGRLQIVEQQGGSVETEQAVERALAYLAAFQSADGRWSSKLTGGGVERKVFGHDRQGAGAHADAGITGLALLCYLAAGHTQYEGPYRETVAKAIRFLSDHQLPDGCLAGDARHFEKTYCHSMALLALGEALAVTGDPRLTPIVRRGVDYSVRVQNKLDGGWRYQPGDGGDMSQFGWKVLALHSASLGGIDIPQTTLQGMHRFLSQATRGMHGGLGCYRPGEMHTPTMTAEALACRFLLQDSVKPETIDEAMALIMRNPPSESEVNYYYWYYATMAAHHAGGRYWTNWNEQLKPLLVQRQIRSGPEAGSFPNDGLWSGYGGKIYSTAMATLCLQAYYRFVSAADIDK